MKNRFLVTLIFITSLLHSCTFFGQDKPIGVIPFTFNDGGHIIISLHINNEKVSDFVLDTGASVTVVDKSIVEQLGLQLQEKATQITGTSGVNNDVKKTQKQRVSLNDKIILDEIELYVSDLSHFNNIKGLIGFDLFKEYVTKTDFDTKTISFYKPKGKPDTKGYQSINFSESFCTPEIKLSVSLSNKTSFSGKVFFDTGDSSSPFTFSSPYATNHQLYSKFESLITTESRGITSKSNSSKGAASSIKIKGFELSEIPVTLSNSEKGMLSKEAYMGNLGLEYIRKFNFILDYNKKKIYLKPNKSFNDAFNFPLSGIRLEKKKKGIFIRSISKPSMAAEKGLKAGQELISINGFKDEDIRFYKDVLKNEGQEVTIVVKLEDETLKTVIIILKRLI